MPSAVDLGVDDVLSVCREVFALDGRVTHEELRIYCPVHEKEGKHSPSCDVNLVSGMWNCFSCRASGDLVSLGVVLLEGQPPEGLKGKQLREWNEKGRKKVVKLLSPKEPSAVAAAIQRRSKVRTLALSGASESKHKEGSTPSLQGIVPSVKEYEGRFPKDLKDRGFTREQCQRWSIRWVPEQTFPKQDGTGSFTIENAIGIPIFDEQGTLLLWCYRATRKSPQWFREMRYLYTPGRKAVLSQTWFGIDHHGDKDHVAVTEGGLDAIWLDQNDIPAIAILGSNTVEFAKLDRLASFEKVTIFTDNDNAGIMAAVTLGTYLLEHGTPARIVRYPPWAFARNLDAKGRKVRAGDPQEVCGLDLELMWERAIPFHAWRLEGRIARRKG